jgi:hypothetical protein
MSERITKDNLQARLHNLNRRMAQHGSAYRYFVQGRNGYTALDRVRPNGETVAFVTAGTKREIADWLSAAMVALDDASTKAQGPLSPVEEALAIQRAAE